MEKTVLIIRDSGIGDVFLATALLPEIRKKYPDHTICFQTKCTEILIGNPFIDKIISKNDTVTDVDITINLNDTYEKTPEVSIIHAYSKAADCLTPNPVPQLVIAEEHIKKADALLRDKKIDQAKIFSIHPASNFWARNLPVTFLTDLVGTLKKDFTFITVGTEKEPCISGTLDFRNTGSIFVTAALVKRSRGLICVDSAIMHIAKSLNVPVVAFFGPTNPELRTQATSKDLIFKAECDCAFCHHKEKPLVYVTICRKQPAFMVLFDKYYNYFLIHYKRAFPWRGQSRIIEAIRKRRHGIHAFASCMKTFNAASSAIKINQWLNRLES